MSDSIEPKQKFPKLIVVMAFDRDESGDLQPVGDPVEFQTEERAVRTARQLAEKHPGVIAWSREARPDIGEYGEPTELYRHGDVPDME
ncbi:MAG: hypothetical protein Q8Q62_18375 [Mesorhizobium sp.]|nr:hypothetical protein [Mesorhizobium sp.]